MSLVTGTDGDDRLTGGTGPDQIIGGAGADTLTGGGGADIFQLAQASDSPLLAGLSGVSHIDHITDWSSQDFLQVFGGPTATEANYFETTTPDISSAFSLALQAQQNGQAYLVVQAGSDVIVFEPTIGLAVDLEGRTLSDISLSNIGSDPSVLPPVQAPPPVTTPPVTTPVTPVTITEPVLPPVPHINGLGGASGTVLGNMDQAHISFALNAVIDDGSDTFVSASLNDISLRLTGFNFALDAAGHLAGGTATSIDYGYGAAHGAGFDFNFAIIPQTSLVTLAGWALADDSQAMFSSMLSGNDFISGAISSSDLLRGYGGNDSMAGEGGNDTIFGGLGDDVIRAGDQTPGLAAVGSTYLRGEEGDDYIIGGAGFDDANGNMGNDTISTGDGDDFSVGGKDNDLLFGDNGADIVWGNLGNDTCDGGNGNDQVRGGQGDDMVYGGAGDDFVSGDRGNDTIVGGAGADLFHGSQDAGIDRVLDFNQAEGDRVELDPGTTYTLTQVGADTVIDMGGGNQMILVGVQMSSLTGNWIFEG